MADSSSATLESVKDFPDTPYGKQSYWQVEIDSSKKMLAPWHKDADRIHNRYVNERSSSATGQALTTGTKQFRLNLFYSNTQTIYSLLYGRIPKVDVKRRNSDARDDVGRVASVIMERLLNNDMASNSNQYESLLKTTLLDRLVPGLGCARVRYDVVTEEVEVTAAPLPDLGTPLEGEDDTVVAMQMTETKIVEELAPADYVHWRDVLWSWARTPADLRWMAFRTWRTKDEAIERYGKKVAEKLQYKQQKMVVDEKSDQVNPDDDNYWLKAEIWEIWCKEDRMVYEYTEGQEKLLKSTPDPLQLRDFFPAPPYLIANPTSSIYKPTPDFHMMQDLYNEIDKLQTRIAIITEAVKVVGIYDSGSTEIQRMFKEGTDNTLIPVDQYALVAEKGGLKGVIDWFPIESVVNALLNLRQLRDESIELLYQISGMADVMRGALSNQYEGVGQTNEKVKFGSVRVQKLHEDFATFASGLMSLKAEIISRHFEPQTILEMSQADMLMEDPNVIAQAVLLLKDPEKCNLSIVIKAESLAMVDYTRLRQERDEFMQGLTGFMGAAAPLMEADPAAKPFLLQMLQWYMAGFRGSDEDEGVLDQAIAASQQAAQNPEPDSEAKQAQQQVAIEQAKAENAIRIQQAKVQGEMQLREQDKQADIATKMAEHQTKMREIEASLLADTTSIRAKAEADVWTEQMTSQANAEQQMASVEGEIAKEVVSHQLDIDKMVTQERLKIREMSVSAATKVAEEAGKSKVKQDNETED